MATTQTPDRLPVVLFGDAAGLQTGLSRILTDLARRLHAEADRWGIDVRTVGWSPEVSELTGPAGIGSAGGPLTPLPWPYRHYRHFYTRGKDALAVAWRDWFSDRPGVVLGIWDAARLEGLVTADLPAGTSRWGYIPVDAVNHQGGFGGPAAEWLSRLDEVIAYGPFGRQALTTTLSDLKKDAPTTKHVWMAPHGVDPAFFHPPSPVVDDTEILTRLLPRWYRSRPLIGCVATNQPRKDWGLVAQVMAKLPQADAWWHVDAEVTQAWSLPELVRLYGLEGRVHVTQQLTDRSLGALYRACALTLAPGKGEGFGYPIVESQLCGTPCLHTNYAGGADLTHPAGLVYPLGYVIEGPYGFQRPIQDVEMYTTKARFGITMSVRERQSAREALALYVHQYAWPQVWPIWTHLFTELFAAHTRRQGGA